ncbi:hypothetical protein QQF64_006864 [Cirrhinus molitorella]|uniref:Uncharacterized protein n=1 Tax=Cirrhinus molitorella TaxID=172907 RepID=A0ABR3MCA3_9TELE
MGTPSISNHHTLESNFNQGVKLRLEERKQRCAKIRNEKHPLLSKSKPAGNHLEHQTRRHNNLRGLCGFKPKPAEGSSGPKRLILGACVRTQVLKFGK